MKPDMKVKLAGLEFTNPVIAASGTFGYGIEFEEIVSLDRIGGFVTKGISLEPIAGHPARRRGAGQEGQRRSGVQGRAHIAAIEGRR